MRSFITGSHMYGKPGPKSDVDLVIHVDHYDMTNLMKMADRVVDCADNSDSQGGPDSCSLMFGKLNLICVTTEDAFAVWKLGTTKCIRKLIDMPFRKRQVKREDAIKVFRKMRKVYLGVTEKEVEE